MSSTPTPSSSSTPDEDKSGDGTCINDGSNNNSNGNNNNTVTTVKVVSPPPPLDSFAISNSFLDVAFSNVNNLISIGKTVPALTPEMLGKCPEECSFEFCEKDFDLVWAEESAKPREERSLFGALFKLCGLTNVFFCHFLYACGVASSFGIPMISKSISEHQSGLVVLNTRVYHLLIALIFIVPVVGSLCQNRAENINDVFACRSNSALTAKIYKKCLSRSPTSAKSTGEITAIYTNDIAQVKMFFIYVQTAIFCPLQIAVCLYLIYREVGLKSMFAGLGVALGALPVLGIIIASFFKNMIAQREVMGRRLKSFTDLLNGIKMVKYYAWEDAFFNLLNIIRTEEMVLNFKMMFAFVPYNLVLEGFPVVMPIVVFYVYIQEGNQLSYTMAFTVIILINILKGPLNQAATITSTLASSINSKNRIVAFLNDDDAVSYVTDEKNLSAQEKAEMKVDVDTAVCFHNAKLGWLKEAPPAEEKEKGKVENVKVDGSDADKKKADSSSTNSSSGGAYSAVKTDDDSSLPPVVPKEDILLRSVNTLIDINLTVKKGQLLAITGPVGSGKSSLLNALLNRLVLQSGSVYMTGSLAYHAQQPWILNATVKENILFGKPDNGDVLNRILDVCTLTADLKTLQAGIMTEIGEKGINLSGGQKARVSFARALYRDADIYILDDPLSAVDAAVGSKMYNEGIVKYLIGQGKTVILATHQVHLLVNCKDIICLSDGKIVARGDYVSVSHHLTAQVGDNDDDDIHDGDEKEKKSGEEVAGTMTTDSTGVRRSSIDRARTQSDDRGRARTLSRKKEESSKNLEEEKKDKEEGKLMEKEETYEGKVDFDAYKFYFKMGYPSAMIFSFLCLGSCYIMDTFANFLIKDWGKAELDSWMTTYHGLSLEETLAYNNKYAWLLMIGVGFQALKGLCGIAHVVKAQIAFHDVMIKRLLSAPLAFFDTTPLGRIITRFSNDLQLSNWLHFQIWPVIGCTCQLICSCATIAINTNGTFLVLLVPLGAIYYHIYNSFSKVTNDLKRIQNLAKSPINVNFAQTLSGIETIISFGESDRFFRNIGKACNDSNLADLAWTQTNKWLMIRLNALSGTVTFAITLLTALTLKSNFIKPEALQLAVTYSQQLPMTLALLLWCTASLEGSMNVIQRIQHYCERISTEDDYVFKGGPVMIADKAPSAAVNGSAPLTTDDLNIELQRPKISIPDNWPSVGVIQFDDLKIGYREDGPMVLKGVTFTTQSNEKIGIVGRTGSGKSTIMTALFHLEKFRGGRILVDGVDLMDVPLHTLRDRICIILQEPVLFVSSLRLNIDPFGKFKDEEIWAVLEKTNMKTAVENLAKKLEEPVLEGGSNFSVGQRQLICFARALLRKPKVLIMDEATASVDNETDALIQKMIREMFRDCTVLTIAHRLNTILDSNKILVLADGRVAEFDTPDALLQMQDGLFHKMHQAFEAEHKK